MVFTQKSKIKMKRNEIYDYDIYQQVKIKWSKKYNTHGENKINV